MNHNSHLLELEEYMYPLVDVARPNTFRNLYPYDEIPKIAFNDRTVPHHMPDQIWITDTTFRDGQQSRAPYTTEQIVTTAVMYIACALTLISLVTYIIDNKDVMTSM